jgi:hypothetical protein
MEFAPKAKIQNRLEKIQDEFNRLHEEESTNPNFDDLKAVKQRRELAEEKNNLQKELSNLKVNGPKENPNYRSTHWDEPNILAHVRMNDRNIEGKKSLHLEEIQSDWHQQGRDRGYKEAPIDTTALNDAVSSTRLALTKARDDSWRKYSQDNNVTSLREAMDYHPNEAAIIKSEVEKHQLHDPEFKRLNNAAREAEQALSEANRKNQASVPNAPFKKTWHELALKRMIREAAEKGYDRLSWTPGEAQADRYSLAKTLNKISYNPKQQYLKAWDKQGNEVMAKEGVTSENLADYVGKEGAQKLMEQKPQDFKHISSFKRDQLKVDSSDEHLYKVTAPDGRAVNVGKGTVGSEAEALEYGERYLNKSAFEINNRRELEYGRLGATHILEGANLKVGGEGMKGFYDKMIPQALEKLGKEHGVKVKTYSPKKVEASPEEINKLAKTLYETYDRKGGEPSWENLHPNKQQFYKNSAKEKSYLVDNPEHTVHYIDIPQSLKNAALHKGFPLFSSTHMFTPVQGNPFNQENK